MNLKKIMKNLYLIVEYVVSPHLPIRHYLYRDIKKVVKQHKFEGDVLDIGCGVMPYRNVFTDSSKYVGIDFKNNSNNKGYGKNLPDIYFDSDYRKKYSLPFKKDSFDHVVSFQVLEHHADVVKFITECYRIVRNRGMLLITLPFIWGLHEKPNDYLRFTEYFISNKFGKNGFKVKKIVKQGSIFSTISCLLTDYLIELSQKNFIARICCLFVYPVLWVFSVVSVVLDKLFPSQNIFLNYLVLLVKE